MKLEDIYNPRFLLTFIVVSYILFAVHLSDLADQKNSLIEEHNTEIERCLTIGGMWQ